MTAYWTPTTASDIDGELLDLARNAVDGWYASGRIDWDNVWDRMDGQWLPSREAFLDLGNETDPPPMKAIRRTLLRERATA
jgi:hypothetical protein